jgi:hypothetical protein
MMRFISDRGVRLAAGLAVVVAIPMAVLFYFQFRSLNDIEATSAVVLRQLSSETADSLTRSIEDYLKRPHISVLLRIQQRQTEPLDLPFIEPVLNDALAESPFVESFFVRRATSNGSVKTRWLAPSCCDGCASSSRPSAPLSRSPRRSTDGRTMCRRNCDGKARRATA